MKRICLITSIICLSVFTAYGSGDLSKEGESFAGGLFAEKETKSEESSSIWGASEESSSEGSSFLDELISDDDNKLYAPPPGEPGNPQKIAPMGGSDVLTLLLMSVMFGIFVYRKRLNPIFSKRNE